MQNLVYGIITVIICIIGYVFAFRQFNKHNITFALILVIICGFILRFYAASDCYLHKWDERYHALVAKNLIDHPLHPTLYDNPVLPYNYKNWTANHTWVHKQPLPLWAMAMSMSVFGTNEIALRLPSIILTTIGIWITFFIALFLFNRRVAFIAAFLYSIHGLIIEVTAGRVATDHIDIFFLFFIQLSVLLAIKYFQNKSIFYNILCGISIGMAILSKWLPALIVLPIWLLLAKDAKLGTKQLASNFLILCSFIVITALPWQLYIFNTYPKEALWENSFNVKHITEALENHGQPFYYHFNKLRIVYGELIYLPLIWFFYKSVKNIKNYKRQILLVWILLPFIFFSMAKTKMQAYTLFTAPAIFIVTGLFWHYLYHFRNKIRFKWVNILILFLLLALPVRYAIERVSPFTKRDRIPAWANELKSLNNKLETSDKIVIFNTDHPIETMFYTDCIAYPNIPDSTTLSTIEKKGYTIFIRKNLNVNYKPGEDHNDIMLTEQDIIYRAWKGNGY